MKKKIAFINQMAPLYRAPIYKLMDKEFDIDWYIGDAVDGIKEMDLTALKLVKRFKTSKLVGKFYWQKDIIKLLFNNKYSTYLFHAEPYSISLFIFMLLNKITLKNKRVYLWTHGWYGRENRWKRIYKKIYFGLSDKNLLYGDFAKKVAEEQGNDAEKCVVIHNSLDHSLQTQIRESLTKNDIYVKRFNNSDPVVIFVGRLTVVKKLDMLIKAVHILKERNQRFNITFVGAGAESDELQKLAQQLDVPVWFYGECYDETQLANLIYNADICVSPGNVGLTAMHSLVYGTPVITHNSFMNQMPEFEAVIEGKTGAFYEYGSIISLADTISNWNDKNRNKREEVRAACMNDIDVSWTPEYQLGILKVHLKS